MSLTKFFLTIEKSSIGRFFANKVRLINQLNPQRIYVENVRSIYNIPHFAAKLFCEMAVIEGIFIKKIGVECKNNDCERIIISVENTNQLPDIISCKNCEILERNQFEFSKNELKTITFYALKP
ncbi:hypothetical protein [Pedobacter kyonggii]|uniref:Uncharacterized protein n=1 Tax=Pedobacter kyonggii TaxID=1926871 RepID=A0A4Q9H6F6_9SPHI|nr:hypothetical protein [Pedobacter kyonggii]TBO36377.1 hypothetical protein EYS08_24905 [Pedobacter kyonggii]